MVNHAHKHLLFTAVFLTLATTAVCDDKDEKAQDFVARGQAKQAKGDAAGAEADYTRAIQLKPGGLEVYINRGSARMAPKNFDGAIEDCTEAIRQCARRTKAYSLGGGTDQLVHDTFAAFEVLAYANCGTAKGFKEDWDGAIQDYTMVNELIPDALQSPKQGELGIAAVVKTSTSRLASAYFARGNTKEAKKDIDGAIADYTTAIQLKPGYADAYYNRGTVRGEKGDKDGMKADHDKALRLKPDLLK